jgi:hypothetical protein
MARHNTWTGILSDFVRKNPRTSAMIAFNLGVWAGTATRKSLGHTDLKRLPSRLVEMVPSMSDIERYVPALPSPLKRKARKAPTRARRTTRTTARRRKRRAA